jgi:predicted transcriptional regulator
MFNISDLISQNVGDLSSAFGLDRGTVMSLVGTGEVEAVSQYIDQISTRREIARAGMFGGSQADVNKYIDEYGGTLLSDEKFTDILAKTISEAGIQGPMTSDMMLQEVGRIGSLDEVMREYLLSTGTQTDQQISLLKDIEQAVGEIAPNISINGVPQGDRGGSFVYEIVVRTDNSGVNGGGPNSGGGQYG